MPDKIGGKDLSIDPAASLIVNQASTTMAEGASEHQISEKYRKSDELDAEIERLLSKRQVCRWWAHS
jgi:hypothetical protein